MSVRGTVRVTCSGCGAEHDVLLVQSINTRNAPDDKRKLLAGELNVLACDCGKRTQLATTVVFHDPDAELYAQVCPGDDDEVARAIELMRAVVATGTRRIVPSLNALVEKVKLVDAGLDDWAIEMTKVVLLATLREPDLDRVLLFDAVDREAQIIRWLRFDADHFESVASPLAAYGKLAERTQGRPDGDELRIDRAWAVEAVRRMIADAS